MEELTAGPLDMNPTIDASRGKPRTKS